MKQLIAGIFSALLLPTGIASAAAPSQTELLERICSLTGEEFFDENMKGVNWPAACAEAQETLPVNKETFPALANDLLSTLKTSHTAYVDINDPRHPVLLDVFRGKRSLSELIEEHYGDRPFVESIGFFTQTVDGKVFISQILPETPAEAAGLLTGDRIIAIDSKPFHPVHSFRNKADREVKVTYQRKADGPIDTVAIPVWKRAPGEMFADAARASIRTIKTDGKRIGYIRFWSLSGQEPRTILKDALRRRNKLRRSDALVLDLRGQIGGSPLPLETLAPVGIPMRMQTRDGIQTVPVGGFKDRIIVLVDRNTRSAAEVTAHNIQATGIGVVAGERTAGAVTAGSLFPLPDGSVLYMAVAGLTFEGVSLEGNGVVPDIPIAFDLPYSAGADPRLDRALSLAAERAG